MKTRQNLIRIWLLCAFMLPAVVQAQFTFTTNNGAITITGYTGSDGTLIIPDETNGYPVTSIGGNYAYGNYGFYSDTSLTNVTIPDSVTNIASGVFAYCSSLTAITVDEQNMFYSSADGILFDKQQATLIEVPAGMVGSYTIPNNVTSIGSEALYDCGSLTNITIGTNVLSIGSGAFDFCYSLTSITVPNSVTNISSEAFYDCGSLTNVTIGINVTSIGNDAFAFCSSLTDAAIPNSVTDISSGAFYYCSSLTNITISANVTSIGSEAFAECSGLIAITVDEQNLYYRSANGILFDKLQSTLIQAPGGFVGNYIIPNSVTSIGDDAFFFCTKLTDITIPNSVTNIGNDAFYYCGNLTSVEIGTNVISIGDEAFGSCSSLTSMTIPNSVARIGSLAFYFCSSLASVTIGTNVTNIGTYAFASCSSLNSIIIPNSVASIGNGAFDYCGSLTNLTIGTNVSSIGSGAFNDCTNLTSIVIPNSVTNIGAGGIGLIGLPLRGNSLFPASDLVVANCSSLTAITVGEQNVYYSSANGILFDKPQTTLIEAPGGFIGSYTIPNSVTTIGPEAFLSCANLTNITIPSSVTNIGNGAFSKCSSLIAIMVAEQNLFFSSINGVLFDKAQTTLIEVPGSIVGNYTVSNNVTSIGSDAFFGCSNLTSITIPNSVTNIGYSAFDDCLNLTGIYFMGNAPIITAGMYPQPMRPPFPIGFNNFYNPKDEAVYYLPATTGWGAIFDGLPAYLWVPPYVCTPVNGTITINGYIGSGGAINIPNTINGLPVTSIASGAFNNFDSLTNVTIGNNVSSIGSYAFEYCTNLTSITIPNNVTNIGSEAFAFCDNLNSAYFKGNAPSADSSVFWNFHLIHWPPGFVPYPPTVYYLPGTQGWGTMFGGQPTVLWNPQAQTGNASFGVRTNRFGFNITGSSNLVIVVEACKNLAAPIWTPIGTNTLNIFIGTNGMSYFSDPRWTNYPNRFYRLRSP